MHTTVRTRVSINMLLNGSLGVFLTRVYYTYENVLNAFKHRQILQRNCGVEKQTADWMRNKLAKVLFFFLQKLDARRLRPAEKRKLWRSQ